MTLGTGQQSEPPPETRRSRAVAGLARVVSVVRGLTRQLVRAVSRIARSVAQWSVIPSDAPLKWRILSGGFVLVANLALLVANVLVAYQAYDSAVSSADNARRADAAVIEARKQAVAMQSLAKLADAAVIEARTQAMATQSLATSAEAQVQVSRIQLEKLAAQLTLMGASVAAAEASANAARGAQVAAQQQAVAADASARSAAALVEQQIVANNRSIRSWIEIHSWKNTIATGSDTIFTYKLRSAGNRRVKNLRFYEQSSIVLHKDLNNFKVSNFSCKDTPYTSSASVDEDGYYNIYAKSPINERENMLLHKSHAMVVQGLICYDDEARHDLAEYFCVVGVPEGASMCEY